MGRWWLSLQLLGFKGGLSPDPTKHQFTPGKSCGGTSKDESTTPLSRAPHYLETLQQGSWEGHCEIAPS